MASKRGDTCGVDDNPRVVLVTGSSRGLGRGIAERLAADGSAVAVNGSNAERTDGVAAAIGARGGRAEAFVGDVTDAAQVDRLVADVEDRLGPIQVLVLNATGPQPEAPIMEVSWEDHLDQLRFFVLSPILLGRAVIPGMRAAEFVASSTSTRRSSTCLAPADRPASPPSRHRSASCGLGLASSRRMASP
jgi:NAD(P)-dependent dehydrogenase (short-subunit alcohol dehydrogenase family)